MRGPVITAIIATFEGLSHLPPSRDSSLWRPQHGVLSLKMRFGEAEVVWDGEVRLGVNHGHIHVNVLPLLLSHLA